MSNIKKYLLRNSYSSLKHDVVGKFIPAVEWVLDRGDCAVVEYYLFIIRKVPLYSMLSTNWHEFDNSFLCIVTFLATKLSTRLVQPS